MTDGSTEQHATEKLQMSKYHSHMAHQNPKAKEQLFQEEKKTEVKRLTNDVVQTDLQKSIQRSRASSTQSPTLIRSQKYRTGGRVYDRVESEDSGF